MGYQIHHEVLTWNLPQQKGESKSTLTGETGGETWLLQWVCCLLCLLVVIMFIQYVYTLCIRRKYIGLVSQIRMRPGPNIYICGIDKASHSKTGNRESVTLLSPSRSFTHLRTQLIPTPCSKLIWLLWMCVVYCPSPNTFLLCVN